METVKNNHVGQQDEKPLDRLNVTVLGAGTMGRQIARLFAIHGLSTRLYDAYPNVLEDVRNAFGEVDNLNLADRLEDALPSADLVIESIYENLEAKRTLYTAMAPFLKDTAIVVSNTSSFNLAELSIPRLFTNAIGLVHFFNPADIIPLVEVVRPVDVDQTAFDNVLAALEKCGKVPVVLKKDMPGFIANRLQAAVLREACYLVASGVAEEGDVDTAMREGIGLRWACAGPFQITDYGGLDIWSKVLESLLGDLDTSTDVPGILADHVNEGKLGIKAGHGFYEHGPEMEGGLSEYRADILRILTTRSRSR